MKVVIEKVNTNTVDVIGKTYDSCTYSGDPMSRDKVSGQTFITTDDVGESMTVRGEGKDTIIKKVESAEKVEIGIALVNAESLDDGKSLATAILKGVWTAKGSDGKLDEVYVMCGTNVDALGEIVSIAGKMARTPTGDRANGKWYPFDKATGKRVLIRMVGEIDKNGKIV